MATDSVQLQNSRGRFVGGNSLGHLHRGQFFRSNKVYHCFYRKSTNSENINVINYANFYVKFDLLDNYK